MTWLPRKKLLPALPAAWVLKSNHELRIKNYGMNITIRRVYLYLTSLIGLILVLIGTTQLVNLALKTWVFTKADDNFYAGCPIPAVVPNSTSTKETLDRAYENCDKNEYPAEQR